ncbi:Class II aaRS and biotin synthetases superfamily protein [Dorcoceras hygrometricum]|uniref:Class II aaRS and biotin synthetases superfamily protein n=1 Tax=Dorcoceras hygrometricum TaxID=472368 RepID=A0A2Z6ZT90_9LAMI|nr:Class II aaRS and biotin synthetases superfamily protein [Dorcoceras hygrometricum]
MTESSRRGGRKGKSVVPPTRYVSPLNIEDLDFLFDDDENTQQEVEVQPTRQQSQDTQGSTSIPSAPTVSMGGRSKSDIFPLVIFKQFASIVQNPTNGNMEEDMAP